MLPPLTDDSITAHIAEIYAYYYNDSEEDDENLESEGYPKDFTAPVPPAISINAHKPTIARRNVDLCTAS
jgi:hypothetical protein